MIPYILTDNSLTVVIDGKAETMASSHPSWALANEALASENWDELGKLFDVQTAVANYVDEETGIEVRDGAIYYEGEVVHNLVVDKVLDFMSKNLPFKPLLKFLVKLMDNPSRRSVDELYKFLEHKSMPITPEGNFLAYKGVNNEHKDFYSGKFDNSVGQVLEMRRNGVCDDANIGCSYGFHAGTYEYAKGYASGGGYLMVVEIDPSDVVSVPHDCDCQKLRTAKYTVVGEYEHIDAPPMDDTFTDEWYDYDDEDIDDDAPEYGAGWDAGYKQAKKDILDTIDPDNLHNN